ncbi:hydrogenase/urease maturation nickel metallochaperone HypA, partial [Chloroflexota bacterium]
AEKCDCKRIKALSVKIGDEHFGEADSLQFCLEATAKGTIAEGARVEIELVGAEEPHQVTLELD